jgi:Asp-tRNA(Asn)/Glu-tRNA(Gln) amidotransferase A subunit family amidase
MLIDVLQLDYTAGIIPVTTVSPTLDAFPADYYSSPAYNDLNSIAKAAYLEYNAEKMKGLPVGVQIAGRRMEEERVLAGMGVVQKALKEYGVIFNPVLQEALR